MRMFFASHSIFFARTEGNISEVVCLGKRTAVAEMASGGSARFARIQPFLVVAHGVRNGLGRTHKVDKLVFGQQQVLAVIGEKHAFVANE